MSREPFEEIVVRYGPMVLRVCRAVLGPADADDAWSETFLSALRAYPELPDGSNVEAWLVTIAHRKAIDQWRGRSRRAVPVADPSELAGLTNQARSTGTEGVPGSWETDLWETLKALPPKQRQSVAYHYLGGLPYADVAVVLGGTAAAARRAAADGIAALRQSYDMSTTEGAR